MNQDKVLELMTELGALHRGHFQLSSGLHSDTYFQCARLLQFPDLAKELGAAIAEFFQGETKSFTSWFLAVLSIKPSGRRQQG